VNAISQLAVVAAVALAAAGGTRLVKGPPMRTVPCDPATLAADELCLEQVPSDVAVLWVDARSRAEWRKNGLPGSVLWNHDPAEDMQAFEAEVAMRIVETPRVIVYCGDENCGVSRQVAKRILDMGLTSDVKVLHGGWRALEAAGRVTGSNSGP